MLPQRARRDHSSGPHQANFDTFQPQSRSQAQAHGGTYYDNNGEIWLQDANQEYGTEKNNEDRRNVRYKNEWLPPVSDISPKEKVMLDFNYKAALNTYEKERKKTLLDVLSKVNHFKLSGISRVRITEYMNRKSREDRLVYPFGVESDPLVLKVLAQVLYDELEKSVRACCTGPSAENKARSEQALMESMSDAVNQIREEEKSKNSQLITNLKSEIATHRQQIKRKNELINRLFSDKTLFTKYFDDFSLLFTDAYRYLHNIEDKQAAELTNRFAKANDFLRWAKDYSEDERKYIVDKDWSAIKEKEKQSLMDDSDLDKSKVWAYKQQLHLQRVSPKPSPRKADFDDDSRIFSGGKGPSKSLEISKSRLDDRLDHQPVSKRLFGDGGQNPRLNRVNSAGLLRAESFEDFASSFHNLTYEQLQEFCLALSDQLAQAKKELKVKAVETDDAINSLKQDFKIERDLLVDEKRELVSIIELERKSRLHAELEYENVKSTTAEAWRIAFDCYNLIVQLAKTPSQQKYFGLFLTNRIAEITDGYIHSKTHFGKVSSRYQSI